MASVTDVAPGYRLFSSLFISEQSKWILEGNLDNLTSQTFKNLTMSIELKYKNRCNFEEIKSF